LHRLPQGIGTGGRQSRNPSQAKRKATARALRIVGGKGLGKKVNLPRARKACSWGPVILYPSKPNGRRVPMKPLSIIVFQKDNQSAESLANSLCKHFRLVNVARDLTELRQAIPQHSADVAIVDLEFAGLDDVQRLRKEFARVSIVCTHRLADERLWSQALAAGAADCCATCDVRAIVLAANNVLQHSHYHAA